MTAVLAIFLLSCGGLLLLVFCKPAVSVRGRRVSIFWTAPLAGALCMILTGQISPGEVAEGLTGAGEVNPLKILVLFFSMTMMSVYLDELGFFSACWQSASCGVPAGVSGCCSFCCMGWCRC
ncbi:MAG: hypothetical protein L6V84_01955 [Oscillospiraceae bacterium]|nr:MAG: hypothetical protein L6V84_01955 [Oscillospiraceae bacterium]